MYTITLNGNSSELSCDFFPPLEVDESASLCLLSLHTNNSIPNIDFGCNTIGFLSDEGIRNNITIPTGSYELQNLEMIIKKLLPKEVSLFKLQANSSKLKCLIKCSHRIDFTEDNSISKLLGFKNQVYSAETLHESESTELLT